MRKWLSFLAKVSYFMKKNRIANKKAVAWDFPAAAFLLY